MQFEPSQCFVVLDFTFVFFFMALVLDAELAFLLEEKEVPEAVIDKIKEYGMTSLSHFVLMAGTQQEWRSIARDEKGHGAGSF